jgi:hypothetical protein
MPIYDWKKSVWKGFRPALIAAVSAAVIAFIQGIDAATLTGVGVPSLIALAIIEGLRNLSKNIGK